MSSHSRAGGIFIFYYFFREMIMGQLNLSVVEIDRILGSGLKTFEKPLLLLQAKELFFLSHRSSRHCFVPNFASPPLFSFFSHSCLFMSRSKKKDRTNARIFAQFRPFLLASSQNAFSLSVASTAHSDYTTTT